MLEGIGKSDKKPEDDEEADMSKRRDSGVYREDDDARLQPSTRIQDIGKETPARKMKHEMHRRYPKATPEEAARSARQARKQQGEKED